MRRTIRLSIMAVTIFGSGVIASGGPAFAGIAPPAVPVSVTVSVRGPDPTVVAAGLGLEFFETEFGTQVRDAQDCPLTAGVPDNPYRLTATSSGCSLPGESGVSTATYAIGLDGVPAGWTVSADCLTSVLSERITSGIPEFTIQSATYQVDCQVYVRTDVLLIDKVVNGGPAAASDFGLEVFSSGGSLVATGSDPAGATCGTSYDQTLCEAIALPSGAGYVLGEQAVSNYTVSAVVCDQYINVESPPDANPPTEQIPLAGATFDHDDGDTYCVITNTYSAPATTTTTTTTTTTIAPTTIAPTTIAPTATIAPTTTAFGAGAATLPATGTSATANSWIALVAMMLVASGGALLLARRRDA